MPRVESGVGRYTPVGRHQQIHTLVDAAQQQQRRKGHIVLARSSRIRSQGNQTRCITCGGSSAERVQGVSVQQQRQCGWQMGEGSDPCSSAREQQAAEA